MNRSEPLEKQANTSERSDVIACLHFLMHDVADRRGVDSQAGGLPHSGSPGRAREDHRFGKSRPVSALRPYLKESSGMSRKNDVSTHLAAIGRHLADRNLSE